MTDAVASLRLDGGIPVAVPMMNGSASAKKTEVVIEPDSVDRAKITAAPASLPRDLLCVATSTEASI